MSTDELEDIAAAALASLNGGFAKSGITKPFTARSEPEVRPCSDAVSAGHDNNVSIIPQASCTDYSSIREIDLVMLAQYTEDQSLHGSLASYPPAVRKAWEQRLMYLQRLFEDCGSSRRNSGGVVQPFPEKLMEVLDQSEFDHIVSWMPHGRAFIVKSPKLFVNDVLPKFSNQSKFMSFTRQLNLWGFKRMTRGMDNGAYFHPLFLRGRPLLCSKMKRQKLKGNGMKQVSMPEVEPNFYDTNRFPLLTKDTSNTKMLCSPPLPVPFNVIPASDPTMNTYFSYSSATLTRVHASGPTPAMLRECSIAQVASSRDLFPSSNMLFNPMYYSPCDGNKNPMGFPMMRQLPHPCASIAWNHAGIPRYPYNPMQSYQTPDPGAFSESYRLKWMAERSIRESPLNRQTKTGK